MFAVNEETKSREGTVCFDEEKCNHENIAKRYRRYFVVTE